METPEIRFAEIFSGAPVIFQDWTTEAYGNRSARWKEVQEALISTGTAANESDALVFVRLISEDVGGDGAHFAYADLTAEDKDFVRIRRPAVAVIGSAVEFF